MCIRGVIPIGARFSCILDGAEDEVGMCYESRARNRQMHSLGCAVEERGAEFVFQAGQTARQRRLADMEALCGTAQAPGFCDSEDGVDLLQAHKAS